MSKAKVSFLIVFLCIVFGVIVYLTVRYWVSGDSPRQELHQTYFGDERFEGGYEYPAEILEIISQDVDILRESLIEGGVVYHLAEMNKAHEDLTENDINAFDAQWRESEASSHFIKNHLNQDISRILEIFQEDHPQLGFVEIFITDEKGVNVGQTNKTSDYNQADEQWWQETVGGDVVIGDVAFDESARTLSIPVSFVIKKENQEGYVGVVRGLIDVLAIRRQL